MTTHQRLHLARELDGTLPAFAWPGGYPIVYTTADGGTLCPDCANGKNGSEAATDADDPAWRIVAQDVHWEGAPMTCDHCGAEVESAYGDPDAGKEEKDGETANDYVIKLVEE